MKAIGMDEGSSHTICFGWFCGRQPPAEMGKQMARGSGVGEKISNHCRCFASDCVFIYCLCLEVRRRDMFLFQTFFLLSRIMFSLQLMVKWCRRLKLGCGLCFKKKKEKSSITPLRILNLSNFSSCNCILAQSLLLRLQSVADCNKKANVMPSFSLLCCSILVKVLQMRTPCRFWVLMLCIIGQVMPCFPL